MAETLTAQQRAAVENRGGSLLVSAAAGSGKTKVLVERLFRYVTAEGRDIDDFLLITYTKAAAAELRGKIAAELSRRMGQEPENQHLRRQLLRVYQADIKTVDSFCTALLRENTHLLAEEGERYALTPDFRVLDQGEADLLREQVLRRELEAFYEHLTPGGELLADTMGAGRDDRSLEALVLEVYEKLQSHASPAVWLERSRKAWADLGGAFDATAWAAELLEGVRREASHWGECLRRGAARTEGDGALGKGYGEKFLSVSFAMEELANVTASLSGGGGETPSGGDGAGIWEAARAAADRIAFPRLSTPKGRKDEPLVRSLKQLWDAAKDGFAAVRETLAIGGADAMTDLRAAAPAMIALLDLVAAFSGRYRLEKRRRNAADFSDQEHLALKLLTEENGEPTRLGRQIAARYVEILVDEYQDTNEVQNAIFRAVSRDGRNLFAVGDVKQSIYRFRLADPAIFLEKYRRFVPWEEAEAGEERKILLSKNFRSRREILDAANFVFSNILSPAMGEMDYGAEEALYFGAAYYPERTDCSTEFHLIGAKRAGTNAANVEYSETAANDETAESAENADSSVDQAPVKRLTAEARFVARRIRQLLDGAFPVTDSDGVLRPCRPEDIVILLRSPRSRTAAFYEALSQENIPCSFEERGGFYHTMEVSAMVSLLQVIDNPRQDVPLIAVLRSPLFGFTPDRLAEIRGSDRAGDYYDAMKAEAEKASGAAAGGERAAKRERQSGSDCAAFLNLLEEFRRAALDLDTHQLIWQIYNRLNVIGVFSAMDGGAERRENLLAFTRQAERYESGGYRGLFAFITQLGRLIASGRADESGGGSIGSGVRLMSIHRSKGLEFPIVILADLDRAFSRQDFTAPVLVHPEMGLGPRFVDLERRIRYPTLARLAVESRLRRENLAEEQRILYVAMTRAKEKLILVDSVYGAGETLQKRAAGSAYPMPPEIVAKGKSFGDWLLPLLLNRPEGEALRDAAGLEAETLWTGDDSPWRIFFHDAEAFQSPLAAEKIPSGVAKAQPPVAAETIQSPVAAETFDKHLLEFAYPFRLESAMPAKVTATQLKGRTLDEEIAENAAHTPRLRPLTQPRFRWREHGLTAAERGTATHLLLQYLDFSGPDPAEQAAALAEKKLLTAEQAAAVDIEAIRRFLASPLAAEIRSSPAVLREYRFTLLLDAAEYDPEAKSGDSILLQGVVDCCFEAAEGWAVVDFKTDHVYSREALAERAEHYRPQLDAYSRALERVLEKNVVRRVLYFLSPGKMVEVP